MSDSYEGNCTELMFTVAYEDKHYSSGGTEV